MGGNVTSLARMNFLRVVIGSVVVVGCIVVVDCAVVGCIVVVVAASNWVIVSIGDVLRSLGFCVVIPSVSSVVD